jgi:soluble lytic murein transglycosylase-like protein
VTIFTLIALALTSFVPAANYERNAPLIRSVEARPASLPYTLPLEYAQLVIALSYDPGVPVWIFCRLIAWESGWQAESNRNRRQMNANGTYDLGIARLNTGSLPWFAAHYNGGKAIDPFDAPLALTIAARYLADLRASTGSWRGAVVAYAGRRSEAHTRAIMGEAPLPIPCASGGSTNSSRLFPTEEKRVPAKQLELGP